MAIDTSLQLISHLRDALNQIGRIVWDSHLLGLRRDGEWPESEFFSAIVNQGFGGLDPRTRTLFDKLSEPGTYRLSLQSSRHNQQAFEPITGADLAVIVSLEIAGQKLARRGFLVQLKKATLDANRKIIDLPRLHHESGERIFNKALHQAERMLLFTDAAVYWIAVPPGAEADVDFFNTYVETTSLPSRRARRAATIPSSPTINADAGVAPWTWMPLMDLPEFEYFLHRWERFMGQPLPRSAQSIIAQYRQEEAERLFRALLADAAVESTRLHGMRSLMSVLAVNAESVMGMRHNESTTATTVFGRAVSLPEFILGDVVADAFGDDNPELLDAISQNRPNDYIFSVLRPFNADARLLSQAPLANATISIDVRVEVPGQGDRG